MAPRTPPPMGAPVLAREIPDVAVAAPTWPLGRVAVAPPTSPEGVVPVGTPPPCWPLTLPEGVLFVVWPLLGAVLPVLTCVVGVLLVV